MVECKECGSILWSARAKELQICSECEFVDESDYSDLEERLENILNQQDEE